MHYLHTILVRKNPHDDIDDIRSIAENATESFADDVYDWRETKTAGRWDHIYDPNVLMASDDLDKVVTCLENCKQRQAKTIEEHLDYIRRGFEGGAEVLAMTVEDAIRHAQKYGRDGRFTLPYYSISTILDLLRGTYNTESMFYDTEDYSSMVDDKTIAKVKKEPESYALVFFDYHN